MKIETEDYVKISTYAKINNCSVTWVYQLIKINALEMLRIDGVKFVKLED